MLKCLPYELKMRGCSFLAPMKHVTLLPFWKLIDSFGAPDAFFTEFFRVHPNSRLEKDILESILNVPSGKPVFAQLLGNDPKALALNAKELLNYPVAGIDLNLGCPVKKIMKKSVGGALLDDLDTVERIVSSLREVVQIPLSVKIRIGVEDTRNFESILTVLEKNKIDLLVVHARTVRDLYSGKAKYEFIKMAVEQLSCPVIANGDIDSLKKAEYVLKYTGCHGTMIGRGAIRNPWIFKQLAQHRNSDKVFEPKQEDVLEYFNKIYTFLNLENYSEQLGLGMIKRFIKYFEVGGKKVDETVTLACRAKTFSELWKILNENKFWSSVYN